MPGTTQKVCKIVCMLIRLFHFEINGIKYRKNIK